MSGSPSECEIRFPDLTKTDCAQGNQPPNRPQPQTAEAYPVSWCMQQEQGPMALKLHLHLQ